MPIGTSRAGGRATHRIRRRPQAADCIPSLRIGHEHAPEIKLRLILILLLVQTYQNFPLEFAAELVGTLLVVSPTCHSSRLAISRPRLQRWVHQSRHPLLSQTSTRLEHPLVETERYYRHSAGSVHCDARKDPGWRWEWQSLQLRRLICT